MKLSFIGMGKLGLPCALAIESKGHSVIGHDPDPAVSDYLARKKLPYRELRCDELIARTKIRNVTIDEAVAHGDVLFIAVQTPHDRRYEGVDIMPHERKDFDYSHLKTAVAQVLASVARQEITRPILLNVISTVLPGTCRRELLPMLATPGFSNVRFSYNPFFAAMGTVVPDFLSPEFVLIGHDGDGYSSIESLINLYASLTFAPVSTMTVESAELTKVMYNCWISSKITLANTVMELCHKNGGDCDEVYSALSHATRRLWSPSYTKGGLGDGGGCHPRDNIAMSWLAQQVNLSADPFRFVTRTREAQSGWLADLVEDELKLMGVTTPVIILGTAFKPETDQTAGSPSLLLKNQLSRRGIHAFTRDPGKDAGFIAGSPSALFVVGCKHPEFADPEVWDYPKGSTVIDPHRYIPHHEGVKVIHVGSNKKGR